MDTKEHIDAIENSKEIRLLTYSIAIPVYNEEQTIELLYEELLDILNKINLNYEIIFVNDGSSDKSEEKIRKIMSKDQNVKLISFLKKSGKSIGYSAAFRESNGAVIITLDADLQDAPAEIPNMLKHFESGYDLIVGWKKNRFENEPLKKIPSFFYNIIKNKIFKTKLHDSNCGFRVLSRKLALDLKLYGDRYRFIPELAALAGYKIAECPIKHRPRKHGKSKYGVCRFFTGFFDIISVRFISSFSQKPLQIFGAFSLIFFFIGVTLEIYVLFMKLAGNAFQTHLAALIIGVLFITVGVQLLGIGLIGEIVAAYLQDNNHKDTSKNEKK